MKNEYPGTYILSSHGDYPTVCSGIYDFCNWLSRKNGLEECYDLSTSGGMVYFDRNGYRLPTYAEWEFAAKGGNFSRSFKYSGSNNIDEVAWYNTNSSGEIHPVGMKMANEIGLYDMTGNRPEIVHYYYYPDSEEVTSISLYSSLKVVGGSYDSASAVCELPALFENSGDYTYRLVRTIRTSSEKVENPVFSPAGGTNSSKISISISSETENAVIKYTLDDSIPDLKNGIIYSEPLEIYTPVSITAAAFKSGMIASDAVKTGISV